MTTSTYRISTQEKKSIVQVETFTMTKDGEDYRVDMEQWWRWGYVVISEVEDTIDPDNPDGLMVSDYSIDDQDLNDGVACYFNFSDNVTDEIKELFEQAWDEDGYSGVEDLGWMQWDMEMCFHGPLEVELLEQVESDESEEPADPSKPVWPFS
jgi:hypothetical protein